MSCSLRRLIRLNDPKRLPFPQKTPFELRCDAQGKVWSEELQRPVYLVVGAIHNRAVYTRENEPRLTLAAAYVSRERNYLYEYKLPGQDKPRLEKAVNVEVVPFIRGVRGLRKPRPELAAAYFLSYKRP